MSLRCTHGGLDFCSCPQKPLPFFLYWRLRWYGFTARIWLWGRGRNVW